MVSPNLAVHGNYLDASEDARRVILEGDGTSDMVDGGTIKHCNPFKYTMTNATVDTARYIMAALDTGYVKMVMIQVRLLFIKIR